jgi:D-amino-acid oxidase
MHPTETITVIGAGVIGLTTALRLLEAGHRVRIVARELLAGTVSAQAGAIWYPYLVEPRARVARWSSRSLCVYEALVGNPATGVFLIDLLVLADEPVWWTEELPAGRVRKAGSADGAPHDAPFAYVARLPLVETPLFLPWLVERVASLGGAIEQGEIHRWTDLGADCRIAVNCTGLGAGRLCADDAVVPIAGHIIPALPGRSDEAGPQLPYIMDERVDELGAVAYLFPRQDLCIIGGSEVAGAHARVDPAIVDRIRTRALRLAPGLAEATLLPPYVGLRPGRNEVRLAAEMAPDGTRLIHNYGHGGAGFTLCWGCADEVLGLVSQAVVQP